MNTNYRILKLSNGENIICNIKDQNESDIMIEVTAPLKMDIMSRVTEEGIVEGLALTRWVQPFTDETKMAIQNSIIDTFSFWLPFVSIVKVTVNMHESTSNIDNNTLKVFVEFSLKKDPGTIESVQVNVGE